MILEFFQLLMVCRFFVYRKHPQIPILLEHLRSNDKKVFLITNSPFDFVDKGASIHYSVLYSSKCTLRLVQKWQFLSFRLLFKQSKLPVSFCSFSIKGMKYIVGQGWEELFDVLILLARKPKFFAGSSRPFR